MLKRWLAEWLCPEAFRNERRYHRLLSQVSTVYRWCDGEAADAAQWLMEGDADHWRSIDATATGRLPWDIYNFREYLRGRRSKAA